jgi:hypothetical protein
VLHHILTDLKKETNENGNSENASGTSTSSPKSNTTSAESISRILSTINAIILSFGSLLCFTEWPYDPMEEGWTGTHGKPSYPATYAALFLGYLQFDLLWLISHRKEYNDPSAAIHHTLFILMTHYVLSGVYFKKAFAWLSFTELSTPFLNARLYYATSGQKDSAGYMYASLLFAFSFILTRVLGYGLGLMDVWMNYDVWKSVGGLYGVAIGLLLGYLLNLFWAIKIIKAAQRVIENNGKNKIS